MQQILIERIERARELMSTIRHAALATVNEDGSPHNSPVSVAIANDLTLFWCSSPDSLHSHNIKRTGQVFVVLFDSMDKGGGLYARGGARELAPHELAEGLIIINRAAARLNKATLAPEHVSGLAPQRIYCAEPLQWWVNVSQKDAAGHILRDTRHEITASDLRA